MAITRAQQAKQMLQDGGMLVQPGFGGIRQGYRGDAAGHGSGDPGESAGPGAGGTGGNTGDNDRESYGAEGQYSGGRSNSSKGGGRNPVAQFTTTRTPNLVDEVALTGTRNFNFMNEARKRANPLGRLTGIPGTIGCV